MKKQNKQQNSFERNLNLRHARWSTLDIILFLQIRVRKTKELVLLKSKPHPDRMRKEQPVLNLKNQTPMGKSCQVIHLFHFVKYDQTSEATI